MGPRLADQRCGFESCEIESEVIDDLVNDLLGNIHVACGGSRSAGEPRSSSDADALSNIPTEHENLVLVGSKGRATGDLESAPAASDQ